MRSSVRSRLAPPIFQSLSTAGLGLTFHNVPEKISSRLEKVGTGSPPPPSSSQRHDVGSPVHVGHICPSLLRYASAASAPAHLWDWHLLRSSKWRRTFAANAMLLSSGQSPS